ncbi:uncharacterized protein BJX67DRAFT_384725 [Aspergillus lucknowensis]|uniref:DUF6590 domain-containing protein n=1 Tax=Aspergillus lucknowensis TaxID=176173 RepID=A0ABR4LFT0_9EURO
MPEEYDPDFYGEPSRARRRGSRRNPAYDPLADLSRAIPRNAQHTLPQGAPLYAQPTNPHGMESHAHYTYSSNLPNHLSSMYGSGYDYRQFHGYQPGASYPGPNAPTPHEPPPTNPSSHRRIASDRPEIRPGHPEDVFLEPPLDPRYAVQRPEYFSFGKVFSILWHENHGRRWDGTHVSVGPEFRGRFGEPIYSTIRRMVVIRAFDQHSWCLSISTYGGRGVAKAGVDPSKHSIVYMSHTRPESKPDEPLMVKEPLEVKPDSLDKSLDPQSRLNFGKIYTVEHNVKVLPIGQIAAGSVSKLDLYARSELRI